jgi:hypothetical protein
MSERWDYLRLERLPADEYRQKKDHYTYATKCWMPKFSTDLKWDDFDAVLEALGSQGWELVTKDGENTFLFKRRR